MLRTARWFHTPLNIKVNHIIPIQMFMEIRRVTNL